MRVRRKFAQGNVHGELAQRHLRKELAQKNLHRESAEKDCVENLRRQNIHGGTRAKQLAQSEKPAQKKTFAEQACEENFTQI